MNIRFLALVMPAVLLFSACDTLQPMVDSATSGVQKVFSEPAPGSTPEAPASPDSGPAPRLSYEQAAVECNQEATRPMGNSDFGFCMRSRGWAPR